MLVDLGSINGWAVLVAAVVGYAIGAVTWIEGAAIGFVLSVGLVSTSLLTAWMFCGLNMKLYWLQVGYEVVTITAMGAILGAWR